MSTDTTTHDGPDAPPRPTRVRPDAGVSRRGATREFLRMGTPAAPRLAHLPGLDGLRGVAVAVVVAYHAGFEVMVGGFLGVSTFFTLSGFLITSLLLNEARHSGPHRTGAAVDLRAFIARRARRLLPASLATLAAVMLLFGPFVATPSQRLAMPGDVAASLFDVANWRFILQDASYGDLFAAPSPVLHFWSLSIEEQFYLVFPVAMAVLWRVVRGRRHLLGIVLATAGVASAALPLVFDMSMDRIYFGTDTRAAELLAGGVLAVALSYRRVRARLTLAGRWRRPVMAAALLCVAVQAWWWWSLPQSSSWLYRGGFGLYALMSVTVITAAAIPRSLLGRVLSVRPLTWLGARSFAIYLVHWPLFLAARQLRPEWSTAARAAVVVAVSLALAELSHRVLERPVRTGRWPSSSAAPRVTVAAVAAVAALCLLPLPVDPVDRPIDFAAASAEFAERSAATADPPARPAEGAPAGAPTAGAPTTGAPATGASAATGAVPTPPAQATVSTFGDSTALLSAMGIATASLSDPSTPLLDDGGDAELGCGISRVEAVRDATVRRTTEACTSWPQRWAGIVAERRPDIALVITGAWEVPDVRLPGAEEWTALGDPATDAFVRSDLALAADTLSAQGSLVVFVLWPAYAPWGAEGAGGAALRQRDPARMQRLHELIVEVAAERPDTVRVFDFGTWLGPDRLADRSLRTDGLHIEVEQMAALVADGLGAEIHDLWAQWWSAARAPTG